MIPIIGKILFLEIQKKTLWNEYYLTEELPQVISPKSGYVYNANHSPFKSTSLSENPDSKNYAKNMGYEEYDNNRSTRIFELINNHESIDYDKFKAIKYDNSFPNPFKYSFMDVNNLFKMNPNDYPSIKELLNEIQNWDRKTNIESVGAGTYAMFYYNMVKYYRKSYINKKFGEDIIAQVLQETKQKMLKYFKTTKVKLGDFQKLVRGKKEIPIWGMPDVIIAMNASNYKDGKVKVTHGESYIQFAKFSEKGTEIESVISYGSSDHIDSEHYNDQMEMNASNYKDGKVKVTHGESYIQFAKFSEKGTEIESVISYGSSDHIDSEHYNDQMEMYAKFQTKKMSFDKNEVYKNAKKIYHPK